MLVLFASGCTVDTGYQTYNANGVSFQYPTDWEQLSPDKISASTSGSAEIIASVVDPNSIQNNNYQTLVFCRKLPPQSAWLKPWLSTGLLLNLPVVKLFHKKI